jgi:hypothetical protein
MKINIQTSEELELLFNALAREIVDAQIYHRLFCDLVDAMPEHKREFELSKTFWHLTIGSLKEAQLLRLCRIFDQESNSLNLVNLLETIKAKPDLFEEERFRLRLSKNAFVDSLAKMHRVPESKQLDDDITYASTRNKLVKKLMIWRNNIVAHRGAKISLGNTKVLEDNPLSQKEIKELLDQSLLIFNRYSSLYKATTWSRLVIGHDDYKYTLHFILQGLQKGDENLENEMKAVRRWKAEQSHMPERPINPGEDSD